MKYPSGTIDLDVRGFPTESDFYKITYIVMYMCFVTIWAIHYFLN